jgi:preprotein translocase SecE subunit
MSTENEKSEKEIEVKSEKSEKISSKSENKSTGKIASWWKETTQFLHEVWVEVRPTNGRVSWPTIESVKSSTNVVIISSLLLGLFIGLCDLVFQIGYEKIMSLVNSPATPGLG